ncbi:MAG: LacI family DNA-binding transcriptional regulator [Lentisphaeria bacterium]|nr:LacI family DNA-binding transcriptional regulator [Lentisphaeria bacterium]
MARVTIIDIARESGKSYTTVSRALSDHPRISLETKVLIRATATRLGYSPNMMAKGLVQRRTQTIGLIATELSNPVRSELIEALRRHVHASGYQLLVSGYQDEDELSSRIRDMAGRQVDGLIIGKITGVVEKKDFWPSLEAALKQDIAVVVFSKATSVRVDCLCIDYTAMARQLTEHFIRKHGFRNIWYLGVDRNTIRQRGYVAAMQAAGLDSAKRLFLLPAQDMQTARNAIGELLRQEGKPQAILCHNDITAIGVMHGLRQCGYRVPEDIAVAGIDNHQISSFFNPALTTAGIAPERVAESMMKLLEARLGHSNQSPAVAVHLPFKTYFRESCGCCCPNDEE